MLLWNAAYLVAEHREERVRAGRVGDVPDEQGHGLVVLDAPLREELGRDGRREDVVAFVRFRDEAASRRRNRIHAAERTRLREVRRRASA